MAFSACACVRQVRQIKEDERRRKSELVHSLRKEYQTTEEKCASRGRGEESWEGGRAGWSGGREGA